MRTPRLIVSMALSSIILVLIAGSAWGIYAVRISDLQYNPKPQGQIKVAGKISSVSPLKISDGKKEVLLAGVTGNLGDCLTVIGDWNGTTLTASQSLGKVVMQVPQKMVYVPAGAFDMGTPDSYTGAHEEDEHPQHSVDLPGYWIGKYEVTRGEYRQFMNAGGYQPGPGGTKNPYWSDAGWAWKISKNCTQPHYWDAVQDWGTGSFTQTDNYPVAGVSYYEAEAYCNWAGGHLPTEAQWEKAARWTGTACNIYPWGDTWDHEKYNNPDDTNPAGGGSVKYQTAPVGSYPAGASPCGCQDMAGNVWEWCQDWYKSYPGSTDPFDDTNVARIIRGGGWNSSELDSRCAYRNYCEMDYYTEVFGLGFRLAR